MTRVPVNRGRVEDILEVGDRSMRWMRWLLLAIPFVIAAVLNCLLLEAGRFHWRTEHIAGYGFLFGTPWAWLLDWGWIPHLHNQLLLHLIGYAVILWIPAALYSVCLWLLLAGYRKWRLRHRP